MVAGDLVNTAVSHSVGSRAGSGARRRGDPALDARSRSPTPTPGNTTSRARPSRYRSGGPCAWSQAAVARVARQALEAPFVGRDRELRLVKDLFRGSADEGRRRVIVGRLWKEAERLSQAQRAWRRLPSATAAAASLSVRRCSPRWARGGAGRRLHVSGGGWPQQPPRQPLERPALFAALGARRRRPQAARVFGGLWSQRRG